MRFRSINFQLQAMVVAVTLGSMVLLGILFQVTQEISYKTNQLSKSADLSSLIKEWETEMNIGTRSRIKFVGLRKPIFYVNYQNSLQRITKLNKEIQDYETDFGSSVKNILDSLWDKQESYRIMALGLSDKIDEQPEQLEHYVGQLTELEEKIKNGLQRFIQIETVEMRKRNLQGMENTLSSSKQLVIFSMATFVVLNILIWLLLKRKILAPLKILENGAMQIGEGALGIQIQVTARNEIGDLVDVINKMSVQLKRNQDAEVKLQKLETIGQVVTSVNHEINNPLMIISGNAEYLTKLIGADDEKVSKRLNSIMLEVRRIFKVTQKLKDIRQPVVETYAGEETTMIDLKQSR